MPLKEKKRINLPNEKHRHHKKKKGETKCSNQFCLLFICSPSNTSLRSLFFCFLKCRSHCDPATNTYTSFNGKYCRQYGAIPFVYELHFPHAECMELVVWISMAHLVFNEYGFQWAATATNTLEYLTDFRWIVGISFLMKKSFCSKWNAIVFKLKIDDFRWHLNRNSKIPVLWFSLAQFCILFFLNTKKHV